MTLLDLAEWVRGVPASLPEEMRPMAESICESFQTAAKRLHDLGLGYLTPDRASSTLSTARDSGCSSPAPSATARPEFCTCWDEPSIGLHPSNIVGLTGVMHDLIADGNSRDPGGTTTPRSCPNRTGFIEMGPGAGADGGRVIAEGTIEETLCRSILHDRPVSSQAPPESTKDARHHRKKCSPRAGSISPPVRSTP